MTVLPDTIIQAWENHDGPVVFSTVDQAGVPNSIYATCVKKYDDSTIIVADNYFVKTRANILAGSKGSLLFMLKTGEAYQLKGTVEYHTTGAYYEHMKQWNPVKHPGHAAAVLKVDEVYCGGEKIA